MFSSWSRVGFAENRCSDKINFLTLLARPGEYRSLINTLEFLQIDLKFLLGMYVFLILLCNQM